MGKYYQIIIILTFALCALYSQAWAWLLGLALLSPLISTLTRTTKVIHFQLISTIGLVIAWVTSSSLLIATWSILILFDRVQKHNTNSNDYRNFVASCLLILACMLYFPQISVLTLLLCLYTFPLPGNSHFFKFSNHSKWGNLITWAIALFIIVVGVPRERKTAYLQHGVWARSESQYNLDSLSNLSAYSYSLFTKSIGADTISQLDKLDAYTELWIVTPTQPFSEKELSTLRRWVANGGHLFLVTDHTDLYGHARVASQISALFGASIRNTSLFRNNENSPFFTNSWGETINIKTGCGASAHTMFPLASAFLWEEKAYYACPNFFGPLSASGDDNLSLNTLVGQIAWGLGQVTLVQDSTIYANFAVFQPGVLPFVNELINSRYLSFIYVFLPFIFVLNLNKKSYTAFIPFTLLSICCLPTGLLRNNINYGKTPQIWTGDRSAVVENGCPYKNISTAYAISPLSGKLPLWQESLPPRYNRSEVIYVGELPPPNKHWRWIKLTDLHNDSLKTSRWKPLGKLIKANSLDAFSPSKNLIHARNQINDRVLGDFWFNGGISFAKKKRFAEWLTWLNPQYRAPQIDIKSVKTSTRLYNTQLYIGQEAPISLQLPLPTNMTSDEIYIGDGISAKVYQRNDTLSLIGYKSLQLNFQAPEIWILDYFCPKNQQQNSAQAPQKTQRTSYKTKQSPQRK